VSSIAAGDACDDQDVDERPGWTVIVPVKGGDAAKSRLEVAPDVRPHLARALAIDTLTAVRASAAVARVIVVTQDPATADLLGIATDTGTLPAVTVDVQPVDEGLNDGIERAAAATRSAAAEPASIAVVVADLPALAPADLTAALDSAAGAGRPVVVADRAGTGTTLLALPAGAGLAAAFGPDSFARHVHAGAVGVDAGVSLRCDVDTLADLRVAADLGLGSATRALLDGVRA
jgi:2-phospho-L-lactate/phosphoenolpyruvate guanylyltransferase